MKDDRRSEEEPRGIGTKLMFGVWLLSSLLFVAALLEYSRRYVPVLENVEVAPPALTVLLLELADFVRSGQGILIALALQGVSLLPFVCNGARRLQPVFYGLLAILGLLALSSIWLGFMRPLDELQALLNG